MKAAEREDDSEVSAGHVDSLKPCVWPCADSKKIDWMRLANLAKPCKVWWHRVALWVGGLGTLAYFILDRVLHFFGICIGF